MATSNELVETEKHHFLPQFYLNGFLDRQGSLWVYEHGSTAPRQSKPKYEAYRQNYYAVEGIEEKNDIERMFGKIESLVAPFFRKLGNPQFNLTDEQCAHLYSFVAVSWARVPASREYLDRMSCARVKTTAQRRAQDVEEFHAVMQRVEARLGKPVGDYERYRQILESGNYDIIQPSNAYNIGHALKLMIEVEEILHGEYHHEFLYAPEGAYFITGDNPVITIAPDLHGQAVIGVGFGRSNTQVLMPLNKKACLLLRRDARGEKLTATNLRVKQVNDIIMASAQRTVYAPEGTRRLARIFKERGCKIEYGKNAFIPKSG